MAVDFPSSPNPGDQFTSGGATWTWDGVKWTAAGTGQGVYLPLTGGVMVGDITLKGDPTLALHPVTKQMWDKQSGFSHDNRICNGDMRIDQRNGGASGTANGYTVDRWQYGANQSNKGSWTRANAGPPLVAAGFGNDLLFTSSSAYASLAGDAFTFLQPIEADMVSDFAWGTPNAQPVTLSFWAWSSLAGTFGGSIANAPAPPTRSYPFSYTLAASTWTKIIVTIPGDTVGTWVMSGNAAGMFVFFDLGNGANFRGPAGAWANANYRGVTGSVSVVGTNAAQFALTGVKLEIGSVATPFNRKSLANALSDCQRYFNTGFVDCNQSPGAAGPFTQMVSFPVTMRAQPAVTISGLASANITPPLLAYSRQITGIKFGAPIVTPNVASYFTANYTADAEL